MNERMHECKNERMHECKNARMRECMNARIIFEMPLAFWRL
jgi:hypothetical protein